MLRSGEDPNPYIYIFTYAFMIMLRFVFLQFQDFIFKYYNGSLMDTEHILDKLDSDQNQAFYRRKKAKLSSSVTGKLDKLNTKQMNPSIIHIKTCNVNADGQ